MDGNARGSLEFVYLPRSRLTPFSGFDGAGAAKALCCVTLPAQARVSDGMPVGGYSFCVPMEWVGRKGVLPESGRARVGLLPSAHLALTRPPRDRIKLEGAEVLAALKREYPRRGPAPEPKGGGPA